VSYSSTTSSLGFSNSLLIAFTAVSPSPSNESPRKGPKRPKIEISESVASDGDYGGLPTDPTGRIMFPDGRLEPKKAFEKRMVEQRRLAKEQDKLNKELDKSKLLSSTGGQLQKKKGQLSSVTFMRPY
jgi:hypothetical protein